MMLADAMRANSQFFVMIVTEKGVIEFMKWRRMRSSDYADKLKKDDDAQAAKARALQELPSYRMNDTLACIAVGSFQQGIMTILELLGVSLEAGIYSFLWTHCRLFDIDVKTKTGMWLSYILLMLGKVGHPLAAPNWTPDRNPRNPEAYTLQT